MTTEVAIVRSAITRLLGGEIKHHMEPEAVSTPGVAMPCYSYVRHEVSSR